MEEQHLGGSWRFGGVLPGFRFYKPDALDAGPIRIGVVLRSCDNSGLEVVRVLHRLTQDTWVWARKKP